MKNKTGKSKTRQNVEKVKGKTSAANVSYSETKALSSLQLSK